MKYSRIKTILENYNPNELRIPSGKEGGGRWTLSVNANDLANSQMLLDAEQKMQELKPTNLMPGYGTPEWKNNRVFTIDGKKVIGYDAAIEEFEKKFNATAGTHVNSDRQVFLMLGPPGAGKSTHAAKIAKEWGAVIADADEVVKALPEYDGGIGANAVHEESTDIAADLIDRQIEKGHNLILQKVGRNKDQVFELISELRMRGYKIHLIDVDVPVDVCIQRMAKRYVETGRYVPISYLKAIGNKPKQVYQSLIQDKRITSYAKIDRKNHVEGKGEVYQTLSPGIGRRRDFSEEDNWNSSEETQEIIFEQIVKANPYSDHPLKVEKNPDPWSLQSFIMNFESIRCMRVKGDWYFWDGYKSNHLNVMVGLGLAKKDEILTIKDLQDKFPDYIGFELLPHFRTVGKENEDILRPYSDYLPPFALQNMIDSAKADPKFKQATSAFRVTDTAAREKELEDNDIVHVKSHMRSGSLVHTYDRSKPVDKRQFAMEDAEPVNHTGPAIANFDPLLLTRKAKKFRIQRRKPPINIE